MSLALLRTTTSCLSSLFLNTHLVLMMFLPFGLSTSSHTSFLVKLFNSSCIAMTQSYSCKASSTFLGSIQETKATCLQKDAWYQERVFTPWERLPMMRSLG